MKENLARLLTESAPQRVEEVSTLEIVSHIVNACAEVKGKDISVLDVRKLFDLSDYFVVVSGRSDRQVQGITNKVIEALSEAGIELQSIEGLEDGQWVLADFGEVVLHVFYEPIRPHYDIEGLWVRAKRISLESLPGSEPPPYSR